MNIRCLCLVRDEADVLRYTLDAALKWAYAIYVCDNGSTDGTWELLQDYASRHTQVVLVGRDYGLYRHSLWGEMASPFLSEARNTDWWCRLDADEIYVDDPRTFLADVKPRHQVVFSASIEYFFTDVDLTAYERDPSAYTERWRPERLRFYLATWSEPRFVRHVSGVEWEDAWPQGFWSMRTAMKRIRLQHYQYRSPPQIERRVHTRITRTAEKSFPHEKTDRWVPRGLREEDLVFPDATLKDGERWRTRIVKARALQYDAGDGEFRIAWDMLPSLWTRKTRLDRMLQRVQIGVASLFRR